MTIYYINPKTDINDELINIMDNLTNELAIEISLNINIIEENNYINLINTIFNIVHRYIKIYKFYSNITTIYVEIYNINISCVAYVYFYLKKTKFSLISSNWVNFYYGLMNIKPIIFDNLSINQKKDLRYAIVSGSFYMEDNIIFTYNSITTTGIILKRSSRSCSCSCDINTCLSSDYIVTIFWN